MHRSGSRRGCRAAATDAAELTAQNWSAAKGVLSPVPSCYHAAPVGRNNMAGALAGSGFAPTRRPAPVSQLLCSQHETDHRTGGLTQGVEPRAERRRTADDNPHSVERVVARRSRQVGPERDRYGSRDRRAGSRPNRAGRPDNRTGAYALRYRPQAARGRPDRNGSERRTQRDDPTLGPLDLHPRLPAARGLSADGGRRSAA